MARRKRKLTKKQRENRNKWIVRLLAVLLAFLIGLSVGRGEDTPGSFSDTINGWRERIVSVFRDGWRRTRTETPTDQSSVMRFLDVGQGSATLIQSEGGTNILVDSGRYDDENRRILQYLDQYIGTGGTIDLLIFTHNDADHIGYGERILQYYDVEEVWMNGVDSTTRTYERVLDAILESDAEYREPTVGDTRQEGPFFIEVMHPDSENMNDDTNEQSIAARIETNGVSVMITGDASETVENTILEKGFYVESEVLLMGHHGSSYSSGADWIEEVNPDIAIYSAGADNHYGHPHSDALNRFKEQNVPVYGTIENGTITIQIKENGRYSLEMEREENDNGSGS